MAQSFQAEIKGIDKLKRRLDYANMTNKPIRQLLRSTGQVIRKEARKEAPEFSGSLKNSIHAQRVHAKGRLPNAVRVFSSRSYAPFVHGDPKISGRLKLTKPFTRSKPHFPPIKKLIPWAEAKGLNPYAVQRSIGKKGTPLVPFFLIAEKNTRQERINLVRLTAQAIEIEYKKGRLGG